MGSLGEIICKNQKLVEKYGCNPVAVQVARYKPRQGKMRIRQTLTTPQVP